jgi:HD superfamily phosphohydrolase
MSRWKFLAQMEEKETLEELLIHPLTVEFYRYRKREPKTAQIQPTSGTVLDLIKRIPLSDYESGLPGLPTPRYVSLIFGKLVENHLDTEARQNCEGLVKAYLQNAFSCSFLNRLNFIRQIGTLSLGVNLDGTHCRLAHTCGTLETALLIIYALQRPLPTGNTLTTITEEQRDAVALAALLHDAFQLPFGHSLDALRPLFVKKNIKLRFRLDHLLVHQALDDVFSTDGGQAGEILESLIRSVPLGKNSRREEILRIMKFIFRLGEDENSDNENADQYFLRDILDGVAIDADRFDYVRRDALHLGELPSTHPKWIGLLLGARVVRENQAYKTGAKLRLRLGFSEEHKDLAKEFLSVRRCLYERFFEAPRKLVSDDTFCHLIYHSLEEAWIGDRSGDHRGRSQTYERIMRLTDHELLYFLRELHDNIEEGCHQAYLKKRFLDVLQNNPFVPLFYIGRAQSKSPGKDEPGVWHIEYPKQPGSSLREARPIEQNFQADLQTFVRIMLPNDFRKRISEEINLWRSTVNTYEVVKDTWMEALRTRMGFTDPSINDFDDMNETFPQILLTVTRFATQPGERPEAAATEHKTMAAEYDHTGEPMVMYYKNDGTSSKEAQQLDHKRRRLRLIVSIASELVGVPNIRNIVWNSMRRTIPAAIPGAVPYK